MSLSATSFAYADSEAHALRVSALARGLTKRVVGDAHHLLHPEGQ
jgi:hypothetical protein